jgi:hypothetical protein
MKSYLKKPEQMIADTNLGPFQARWRYPSKRQIRTVFFSLIGVLAVSGLMSSLVYAGPPHPSVGWWTVWLDRDNPSGSGDWEHRNGFGNRVCSNPTRIEARRKSDRREAAQTGETFLHYNPRNGFVCLNRDQSDKWCFDYEVRFLCPYEVWTDWLNRDNPNGSGDWEHRNGFGNRVCSNPTRIEARRKSDRREAAQTGETFLRYDPRNGFVCLNSDQSDKRCFDYEVRFLCPR